MNIKQKIYLVFGFIIIICILLIWGVVRSLILEIQRTSVLAQERNEELLTLKSIDQNYLKQLESDYNDVEEDISLVKSNFLNSGQAVNFFITLEDIASSTSNNLKIEAGEFPFFTLYLTGDFPSLMKFLGWLENGKYFIGVDSIQIRQISEKELFPEGEAPSIVSIGTTLKIRSYIENPNLYESKKNPKTH